MYTGKRAFFAIALALLLACGGSGAVKQAGGPLTLKLRMQPGDRFLFTTLHKAETPTARGEQLMTTYSETALDFELAVTNVAANGNQTAEITIRKFVMDLSLVTGNARSDQNFRIDSENPGDNPKYSKISRIIGQPVAVTFDADGNITDKSSLFALLDKLEYEPEAVRQLSGDQMPGKEQFVAMLNIFAGIYPDGQVTQGQSWSVEQTNPADETAKSTTTYTLSGRKNGVATVRVGGSSSMTAQGQAAAGRGGRGGSSMTMVTEGKKKGTMKLDEAVGVILESSIEQEMTVTVTQTNPRDPAQSNTSKTTTTSASTVKAKKM